MAGCHSLLLVRRCSHHFYSPRRIVRRQICPNTLSTLLCLDRYFQCRIQGLLILNILLAFYCGNSLTPAINRARDAGEPEALQFKSLHRRSVMLNSLSMLIAVVCLISFEGRNSPTTAGIVEEPVETRAERDRQFRQTLDELLEAKAKRAADKAKARGSQTPEPTDNP
jgi:hypothetical protein